MVNKFGKGVLKLAKLLAVTGGDVLIVGILLQCRGQANYGELGYGANGKKSSANPGKVDSLEGVKTQQVLLQRAPGGCEHIHIGMYCHCLPTPLLHRSAFVHGKRRDLASSLLLSC